MKIPSQKFADIFRAGHPGWRRCSSLTYSRYAPVVAPCHLGAALRKICHRLSDSTLEFYRTLTMKTIDAHAEGGPLRLVVHGFPSPRGGTMLEKREWAGRHTDHLRRALMLEPRGHADMFGAVLTEPVSPASHAGVLFMHNEGFSTMCGHGIIALTTIALERGSSDAQANGSGPQSCSTHPLEPIRARADAGTGSFTGAGREACRSSMSLPSSCTAASP